MGQGDGIIDADIGQIHNAIRAAKKALSGTPPAGIKWPRGYCLDPNGRMRVPDGRKEDWDFGYDIGFAEALGIKERAVAARGSAASPQSANDQTHE